MLFSFTRIYYVFASEITYVLNFCFFSYMVLPIQIDFIIDLERIIFFFCVSCISISVFNYSHRYIQIDIFKDRFFLLLFSFVASIFILVFSSNIFCIIVGWDGLGVTSFLLVVYFQNKISINAGLITVLTNRLGDVFLLSAIALLIPLVQWNTVFLRFSLPGNNTFLLGLLFLFGAFTKRAQIPFSRWLPAAMAAPTPVSSLVHSRTLVTAGVFLLLRFKRFFLAHSTLCLFAGSLTMCIAGIVGLFEADFKKIVALSTLRQLGLIISSLGVGAFSLTFFHLITHAFFKALLFLTTGSTIHSAKDYQDLRKISLPGKSAPRTLAIMLIANFRLIGLPFLAGFYSKDLILELMLSRIISPWIFRLFFWGTILTVLYSMRFMLLARNKFMKSFSCFAHTSRDNIIFSAYDQLFWLAVSSGAFLNWLFLKFGIRLILSPERKNFTFFMICFTLLLTIFYRQALGFLNKQKFLKWSLSRIWCLVFLRSRIGQKILFEYTKNYEKVVEKYFVPKTIFSYFSISLHISPILKIRSLPSFYLGFTCWVVLLLFFK